MRERKVIKNSTWKLRNNFVAVEKQEKKEKITLLLNYGKQCKYTYIQSGYARRGNQLVVKKIKEPQKSLKNLTRSFQPIK